MFTNVRWNEKNDVIIVCFPILDEMKRRHIFLFSNVRWDEKTDVIIYQFVYHNCLFPNVRWNEKNDVIIFCLPILDEMKRMTS